MSTEQIHEQILDRLRANMRAAGISASAADIQGIVEKGFLRVVAAFEAITMRSRSDPIPAYLETWGDAEPRSARMEGQARQPDSRVADSAHGADSIVAAGARLRAREVSPIELAEQALARITERDPLINAFQLVLAERARAAAARAEREIADGDYRGPLHGIPLAIKDLLALEGTPTTAGSKILAGPVSNFTATVVERLEQAGAVIVGKTRMSEFAYSPGSNNAHYGPTRNPRHLEYDTGGSSSGSSAAVADGMVYGAIGSDTGGSIRIPAALCGIVGLKPTYGRIGMHGAVTLAWSLDHLGPLARSVTDVALMTEALSGDDPRDPRSRRAAEESLTADLDRGVIGLRIGVLGDDGSGNPLGNDEALKAWQSGLAALERAGAELIPIDMPELDDLRILNGTILALEAVAYHEPMLRERLEDYGEFMRQRVLAGYAFGPGAFIRAQQARAGLRRRCAAIFERIDLLSTPTMPGAAPPLGVPSPTTFTGPFNILGWPAISVPVGRTAGQLPLGMQLAGRPWDEATLLRAARAVETRQP